MKKIILFWLIFFPIFCQGQNDKEYSYLSDDNFTKVLYDAIEKNAIKNLFNANIHFYKLNEDSSLLIEKKKFINKYWKNIAAEYKSADLVIVRHGEQKNMYLIYNHCYKHQIIIDDKQKIVTIYEIDIPSEKLPCFESKRIF